MRDVKEPLRKAYFTALAGANVPVYYQQAEDGITGNYIIFKPTTAIPVSMKSGESLTVQMEVKVTTENMQYNDGTDADRISGDVLLNILPTRHSNLSLGNNLKMTDSNLVSDTTEDWSLRDKFSIIERTLIFSHTIYIN